MAASPPCAFAPTIVDTGLPLDSSTSTGQHLYSAARTEVYYTCLQFEIFLFIVQSSSKLLHLQMYRICSTLLWVAAGMWKPWIICMEVGIVTLVCEVSAGPPLHQEVNQEELACGWSDYDWCKRQAVISPVLHLLDLQDGVRISIYRHVPSACLVSWPLPDGQQYLMAFWSGRESNKWSSRVLSFHSLWPQFLCLEKPELN